jgi:Domain of unknown function (DUF4160)
MATALAIHGWRLFFWENEGREAVHVHARQGKAECRFRLFPERFDIEEDWAHQLSAAQRRQARKIIFENFDLIVEEWTAVFRAGRYADE